MDLAITFFQYKYIIEMKVWRGDAYHESGLEQLADYLDRQNLDTGYPPHLRQQVAKEIMGTTMAGRQRQKDICRVGVKPF